MAKIVVTGVKNREKAEKLVITILKERLKEVRNSISQLLNKLKKLEEKYGMTWKEFKVRFEKGDLPDDADRDYVEWEAVVTLLKELKEEEQLLCEILEF